MRDTLFAILRSQIRGLPWTANWQLPKWQAHRGYHLENEKENTLGSLIAAAQKGAAMCEFDVRWTRDFVPVLFHDTDLLRITGRSGSLREISLKELREFYDVATLEDILRSPKVPKYLNIELKSEEVFNDPLERKVAEVIQKTKAQDRVLFSSFNPISLWKMTHLLPEVPRALLVAPDLKNPWLREMVLAPMLQIHALHLQQEMIASPEAVHVWQRQNLKLAVWTVNQQSEIEKYWTWGIDSVISDLIPTRYS